MKRLFVFLILLVFAAMPVFAQETGTPVRLGSGYGISVPEGWSLQETRRGYYELARNTLRIRVYSPPQLQSLISLSPALARPENFLREYSTHERIALTTEVAPFAVPDRTAFAASFQGGKIVVVEMQDGTTGLLEAGAGVFNDVLIELSSTFSGEWVEGEEADLGGFAEAVVAEDEAQPEPCVAYVVTAGTAQLRVGPGENRGVIAFFSPGINARVNSRFVDDRGNTWYQLAEAEAFPGSSANEIWVAAGDISLQGNCNVALDREPPPVIQSFTSPAASGGTTTGSDAPVVGAVPLEGTWTLLMNPMSDTSCLDTENFQIPTVDAWVDGTDDQGYMDVLNGGAVLSFYSDQPFIRVAGTSNYYGTIDFGDGSNTQVYLTVVNNSLMTGTMIGNILYDGYPCSATTQITMRRG